MYVDFEEPMRTDPDTVDISILNVAITEDDSNKEKGKLCLTFTSCISQEKTSVVKMERHC